MAFLFEYGEWVSISNDEELRRLLEAIWSERIYTENIYGNDRPKFQPFLHFDGSNIRARNYSGFIQLGEELVEIYPKVFRQQNCHDRNLMLNHIFYWLSYCRKWKFPFTRVNLELKENVSFPEIIIYLIAKQVHSVIETNPFAQYQLIEEALTTPRGSINFSRYIDRSLNRGALYLIECDHEPLLFDNKVNRLIKYCTRLLLNRTGLSENIRILQEILFQLDEVTDIPCTLRDAESISLNTFYDDYSAVVDSCKMILSQQLYSGTQYDLSQWCLLLPMEYIFEDFVAGILETHFKEEWKIHYQKSDLYLSDSPLAFNLQQDIFLQNRVDDSRKIIIDAKYKMRQQDFKNESKKGISQSDLYQMVSYAYKRGCSEVILIYPNINEEVLEPDIFEIKSGFDPSIRVTIRAIEIPFWSINNFSLVDRMMIDVLKQILSF